MFEDDQKKVSIYDDSNLKHIENPDKKRDHLKLTKETNFFNSFIRPAKRIKNSTRFVIYPESRWRKRWELFITFLLLYACCATPYILAFEDSQGSIETWTDVVDLEFVVDVFFFFDLVANFFFAYYNNELDLVDDKKKIAMRYMKSWFLVDLMAVFPFDTIF
jgi:hypothetical protein